MRGKAEETAEPADSLFLSLPAGRCAASRFFYCGLLLSMLVDRAVTSVRGCRPNRRSLYFLGIAPHSL
jgi:hypothetical protein